MGHFSSYVKWRKRDLTSCEWLVKAFLFLQMWSHVFVEKVLNHISGICTQKHVVGLVAFFKGTHLSENHV